MMARGRFTALMVPVFAGVLLLNIAGAVAGPVSSGAWRALSSVGDASIVIGADGEIDEIRVMDVDSGNPYFGRKDLQFGTGPGYHHIEWVGNTFTAGASIGSYSATRAETHAFRVLGTVVSRYHIEATWSAFGSDSYMDAQGKWQYEQYALQGTMTMDWLNPAAPGVTLALDPVGLLPVGQKRPVFSWTVADGATWYRMIAKQDGRMALDKWIEAPATTYTPSFDLAGGDYTWQVAGWNSHGLGQWSSGAFSIPVQRPNVLTQIAPVSDAVLSTGTVTYSFLQDPMAAWSQIWIDRNYIPFRSQWVDTSAPTPTGLVEVAIPGHLWGQYRWCVRGWGQDGMGKWSGLNAFTIGVPLAVSGSATEVVWDDTPVSVGTWYQVWVGVPGSGGVAERTWWFPKTATTYLGGGHRSIPLAPPLATGDYYWLVRAWELNNGLSPWSEPAKISVP